MRIFGELNAGTLAACKASQLIIEAKPMKYLKIALLGLMCFMFAGCTIHRTVRPVERGVKIQKIYVQHNPKVLMKGFHDELVKQLEVLGFQVETFSGERPKDARVFILYTANWNWDLAMYLTYFEASLLDNGVLLGRVEYDSRRGGGRMDKFGGTADKIRPLLIELFQGVERVSPVSAPVMGSGAPAS